jgi:hypothetical protein
MTSMKFRVFAHLVNFASFCPQLRKETDLFCPAARLNGKIFHENWLHNLFISASLGGENGHHYNPLLSAKIRLSDKFCGKIPKGLNVNSPT